MIGRASLCFVFLAAAALMPAAASAALPSTFDKGFIYTGWWHDDYATAGALTSLTNLKATGATSVALTPIWFQATKTSTTIAPDANKTPDDASITTAVTRAKSMGLKVVLRPLVDSSDGTFRGSVAPSDRTAWFASYRAFVDHYATLAESLGVAQLSLGAEMKSMSGYASDWRTIIADARTRFHGALTYSANWDEYKKVTWWDALDLVGIDAYFPLVASGLTPAEDTILADWSGTTDPWGSYHNYLAELDAFHTTVGKPIEFTELGYTSTTTNLVNPWATGGTYDGAAQQRAFGAFFRAFQDKTWFRGAYIWNWDVNPAAGGVGGTSHLVQGKPAQQTITSWFTSLTSPSPTPTPTPTPTCGTKKKPVACAAGVRLRRSQRRHRVAA